MYIFPDCKVSSKFGNILPGKKLFGPYGASPQPYSFEHFEHSQHLGLSMNIFLINIRPRHYGLKLHETDALNSWTSFSLNSWTSFSLNSWTSFSHELLSERRNEPVNEASSAKQANKWSVREYEWAEERMAWISYIFFLLCDFDHLSFDDVNLAHFFAPSQPISIMTKQKPHICDIHLLKCCFMFIFYKFHLQPLYSLSTAPEWPL